MIDQAVARHPRAGSVLITDVTVPARPHDWAMGQIGEVPREEARVHIREHALGEAARIERVSRIRPPLYSASIMRQDGEARHVNRNQNRRAGRGRHDLPPWHETTSSQGGF